MYCFGAIAGLMVIGHIAIIADIQAQLKWGFALVASSGGFQFRWPSLRRIFIRPIRPQHYIDIDVCPAG
ncbi:MAG: hypothetical protein ACOXZ6_08455, partial [Syntrophomonadaceae bacterium]